MKMGDSKMGGTIQSIPLDNIINYFENPRHDIGIDEKDTLKKLFDAVGTQYMLNLAEDIQKHGLLGCQHVTVVKVENSNEYIVYEGNRRVAALKLLAHPDSFEFLDKSVIEKAKKLALIRPCTTEIQCYITDEEEAFFIMERLHSGEDRGRGTKSWASKEKANFSVRRNNKKTMPFLIDFYARKYYKNFDITTIMPFTTLERIFNNRQVKKIIGIDINEESTFSKEKIQLIIEAARWITDTAKAKNQPVTRLFNKADEVANTVVPWIKNYQEQNGVNGNNSSKSKAKNSSGKKTNENLNAGNDRENGSEPSKNNESYNVDESHNMGSQGGSQNLPYFFQGINFSTLNPSDIDSHGISRICNEIKLFSEKRMVKNYPLSATFLTRAIIEHSIIYYSKKHKIQGQDKLIWEDISGIQKLSKIIEKYKKNLANYISDTTIRQYFNNLFDNYENTVDPLNWVIHRPAEFQLDSQVLIDLPRQGLLSIINYFLS